MIDMRHRVIDMTASGEFADPPARPSRPNWPLRLGLGAAAVATIAGALALAAIFLWLASVLLPVAIVAGFIAFAAFKLQGVRRPR
jgi:hypothetical protein